MAPNSTATSATVTSSGRVVRSKGTVLDKLRTITYKPTGLEVVVKLADGRAALQRQDLFDKVRYITETEDGRNVTERSFPMGQLRLRTIMLVIQDWNVFGGEDNDAPKARVSEDNVQDLLQPDEIEYVYNEIIDMNPAWSGKTDEGEA